MTTLADRTIAALRTEHDGLGAVVPMLSDEQLSHPSGASEWTLAQVLSHLGSGAEIALAALRGALGAAEPPPADFNSGVWARWDAMQPGEQATGYLARDAELVAAFEALSPEQRDGVQVTLGFLPEPVSLATFAGLRLTEVAEHSWDVRVGLDPDAALSEESAELLLEHLSGGLGFLPGFIGKAEAAPGPAVLSVGGSRFGVHISDRVSVSDGVENPTAELTGPLGAAALLISGRLTPAHTPAGVAVTGNLTLAELRQVFPGY
jgi:uncharacterized protein (TIGR03083 family)